MTLQNNIQSEVSDFLDGTSSPTQFLSNIEALAGVDLGYSSSLQAAGDVILRADENTEIPYTVKADNDGLRGILQVVTTLANLSIPDPAVDVATEADFDEVVDGLKSILSSSVENLDTDRFVLNSRASNAARIQANHEQDVIITQGLVENEENVNIEEAIIGIQFLQNQISASFQVTSIASSLRLVNFI